MNIYKFAYGYFYKSFGEGFDQHVMGLTGVIVAIGLHVAVLNQLILKLMGLNVLKSIVPDFDTYGRNKDFLMIILFFLIISLSFFIRRKKSQQIMEDYDNKMEHRNTKVWLFSVFILPTICVLVLASFGMD